MEREEIELHLFLTSALEGGEMLTSNTGRIISRKEPQYRLNMRIRGLRIRSGCFEKKENLLTLRDFELRTARFAA